MAFTRLQKEDFVAELKDRMSQAAFIINFAGMTSNEINAFRTKAREKSIYTRVFKNSLVNIAFKHTDFEACTPYLKNQSMVLIPQLDNIGDSAKLLAETIAGNKSFEVKCLFVNKEMHDMGAIAKLALIPNRKQAIASLAYAISSPIVSLSQSITQISKILQDQQSELKGETPA